LVTFQDEKIRISLSHLAGEHWLKSKVATTRNQSTIKGNVYKHTHRLSQSGRRKEAVGFLSVPAGRMHAVSPMKGQVAWPKGALASTTTI